MILLTHEAAAELLFVAALIPASVTEAGRAVAAEYRRRHGDLAGAAADMAQTFGDHPAEAQARMQRCLAVAPLRVELLDVDAPALPSRCESDGCGNRAPLELVGEALLCLPCVAHVLLAETAGFDDEGDGRG